MSGSIIVINVDIRETRVALVEGGVIAELQIERASHRGTVGNIVLGKVTRVLPGMQAAFIDVGQERSAFLHVEDLIRPDDFEHYLAGGADEQDESFRGTGERKATRREEEDEDEDDDADESAPVVAAPGLNGSHLRTDEDAEADDDEEDGRSEDDVVAADSEEEASAEDTGDDTPTEDEPDEPDEVEDESDESDEVTAEDDLEDVDDDEDDLEDTDDPEDDDLAAIGEAPFASAGVAAADAGAEIDSPVLGLDSLDPELDPGAGDPESGDSESPGRESVAPDRVRVEHVSFESTRSELGRSEVVRLDSTVIETTREPTVPNTRLRSGTRPEVAHGEHADGPVRLDGGPDSGRGRNRRGRGGQQGGRGRRGRQRGNGNPPKGGPSAALLKGPSSKGGPSVALSKGGQSAGANNSTKLVRGRRAVRGGKPGGRVSEGAAPPRVTRSVPITDVVSEGDQVVVQISKEPIGTKGARVTSHVSLPGRYVVYLPTVDHLGISKRIGSARERARLRQVMESLKPARGGLIVRTVAEGLTKKQLKADVGYLIRVWAEVCKKRETARPAEVLYTELDLVLKVARDLFTDEVKSIVIDDREQYARLVRFVEMFLPERVKDIELYTGSEPIFDAYGIEDEIGRALSRKVPLPSGGSLIVDQAEALTAIDVNTGRYVGKGSKDLEETALKTNLEAVEEIAYQLRFRNIGGLVILDLIDMEKYSNREKVWRALEAALVKDKAKTTLNRISELGLIEMTRKRTRESLGRMLHEPCFYCDGTGQIQSKATIAYEILRQIGRERYSLPGYSVVVNAHPAIVDFLKTVDRAALDEADRRYARRIELTQRTEYHIEQYDLQGK
jgi:ribonuclease G